MKKKINYLIDLCNEEYLEFSGFILLMLWCISPVIEYFNKNYFSMMYKTYFKFTIYVIGIFGILIYILYVIKKRKKEKFDFKKSFPKILLFLLLVIAIIASLTSSNVYLSFFGEAYRKEGLIVYLMYLGIILLASIVRNKKYQKCLFNTIISSALIIAILPLFKSNFSYYTFANVFNQFNHYGYYLMIATMLSGCMFLEIKGFKRVLYLSSFTFLLHCLILNNTFGCYLAITISLVVLLIYLLIVKEKRISMAILILSFILVTVGVSYLNIRIGDNSNKKNNIVLDNFTSLSKDVETITENNTAKINKVGSYRGILWKEAWNYIKEHPLLGGGMESLNKYYDEHLTTISQDRPHNIILQFAAFIGIPGAIIYVIFISFIGLSNIKRIKTETFYITIFTTGMCYFISSLVGNSMYYTSPYFMIFLGLLIMMYECNYEKRKVNN